MVQAWYMDTSLEDQRLEHHKNPPEFVDPEVLYKKSGVQALKLNPETFEEDGSLEKVKTARGYNYQDVLECSPHTLSCYEEKIKNFFTEHLHTDEEVRFVIDGAGYFDVRDCDDQWIRVLVTAGDLLILPAGIYHRFTLDTNNYIKVIRLFAGTPVWTAHNRPAEEMDCRKIYVRNAEKGFEE